MSDATSTASTGGTLAVMPTLVRDPQPSEFEALLQRRRRLGQDLFDEAWEGVLHMNPELAICGDCGRRHGRVLLR